MGWLADWVMFRTIGVDLGHDAMVVRKLPVRTPVDVWCCRLCRCTDPPGALFRPGLKGAKANRVIAEIATRLNRLPAQFSPAPQASRAGGLEGCGGCGGSQRRGERIEYWRGEGDRAVPSAEVGEGRQSPCLSAIQVRPLQGCQLKRWELSSTTSATAVRSR